MRRFSRFGPARPAIATAVLVASCGSSATVLDTPVLGVDLSYVNEVEDCGGVYRDTAGETDPFAILAGQGANLVRARLWNDPDWTEYSTLEDVIRTFERAKAAGMATLLDFHYSDEWADPGRQTPPAAWAQLTAIDETAAALGEYTTGVLTSLDEAGVLPDMVQIGNEINGGLVKPAVGLDWDHDAPLLTAGIAAVRAMAETTGQEIAVMLHVAQPENGLAWFAEADEAGLDDFDVIGLSYYPQWSRFSVAELGNAVQRLGAAYQKQVLVVETGYPWTTETAGDTADNVLDQGLGQYPMTPEGQGTFMEDLTAAVVANGGMGTVYWEPAWLSTGCHTRWGQGSHWENATLFDFAGELHAGASYLGRSYPTQKAPDSTAVTSEDASADASSAADLTRLSAVMDDDAIRVSASVFGDFREWPGVITLAIGTAPGGGDGGRRPFDYAEATRPELVLETSFHDEPGLGYFSPALSEWRDGAWAERTFTGSVTVEETDGGGSTVVWTLPRGLVGESGPIELTLLTAGKGRAGDLEDSFGDEGEAMSGVAAVLSIGEEH
ncbi:MAG TPA: glycosyl hydrolase 53 family protein [Acidimicrobiia bacterium]|nr:glycosyl hydrolase 53 family protein [Acidimicrobiia bacterium]